MMVTVKNLLQGKESGSLHSAAACHWCRFLTVHSHTSRQWEKRGNLLGHHALREAFFHCFVRSLLTQVQTRFCYFVFKATLEFSYVGNIPIVFAHKMSTYTCRLRLIFVFKQNVNLFQVAESVLSENTSSPHC